MCIRDRLQPCHWQYCPVRTAYKPLRACHWQQIIVLCGQPINHYGVVTGNIVLCGQPMNHYSLVTGNIVLCGQPINHYGVVTLEAAMVRLNNLFVDTQHDLHKDRQMKTS